MVDNLLCDISSWGKREGPSGIPSVCSAHPSVLIAALRSMKDQQMPLLIEATCNQVNQDGGYTGMTPADFRAFVMALAAHEGFPEDRIILGGDHLGPSPWKDLPPDEALAKADAMIAEYALAGFTKLHLDCSMGCKGEPIALGDAETAARAARLAKVAEAHLPGCGCPKPVYVIGTEVPVPGGALEELGELELTEPAAVKTTREVHAQAFRDAGLEAVFNRSIAIVVQPGVEFGNHNVVDYNSRKAQALSATLAEMPGMVFEAHSTDYQGRSALRALVSDGFAILKVGPGLTFRWREALYGLDQIAEILFPGQRKKTLRATMEEVMLDHPKNWARYYEGAPNEQAIMRHYSYSDRIRYYWPDERAQSAETELFSLLDGIEIPEPLVGQYLGAVYTNLRSGFITPDARTLAIAAVRDMLEDYIFACGN